MVDIFTEEYEKDSIPVKKKSWAEELLDSLELMSLENIGDYQLEIGTFLKCKETTKNPSTAARLDLIIFMTRYLIEENYEDVTRYREWEKEFS